MYIPKTFAAQDAGMLKSIVEDHPLATVVTVSAGRAEANLVPLFWLDQDIADAPQEFLVGHVASANPLARQLATGCEVLCLFHGPHGYISPTSYSDPQNVPTWNYAVAQVRGHAQALADARDSLAVLRASVRHMEKGRATPWDFEADDAFILGLLPSIVAFRIAISICDGKLKLSQNRSAEDRAGVLGALDASGRPDDAALSAIMRRV